MCGASKSRCAPNEIFLWRKNRLLTNKKSDVMRLCVEETSLILDGTIAWFQPNSDTHTLATRGIPNHSSPCTTKTGTLISMVLKASQPEKRTRETPHNDGAKSRSWRILCRVARTVDEAEAKAGPPITRHFTFFLRHIAATPHRPSSGLGTSCRYCRCNYYAELSGACHNT